LEYLDSSTPFFVRCIKPNEEQKPNVFDSQKVNKQLRSAGIPAVIRIRKAGFPVRMGYGSFVSEYRILFVEWGIVERGRFEIDAARAPAFTGEFFARIAKNN
jgi:myosin heavy subunit